ncbi:MAG: excinuclease ABC subunit UvrA [bacterium]|nr:excinuclease ABC subunit UvrA [bacterium]
MSLNKIIIKGAKEHNLKNIDLEIPRNKLVVITGLSGSGKSSLAFDTIYAEGQRRYVESLSAYARQFLNQMQKPNVDYIEGLSPTIAIEQKGVSKNPRSTVGTITEIYDYLRLLFARIGKAYCYKCHNLISKQSTQEIIEKVKTFPLGTKIQILAPIAKGKKGEFKQILESIKKEGYVRIRLDKKIYDLDEEVVIDKNKKHDLEVVVDRLIIKDTVDHRLADSIETAIKLGSGIIKILLNKDKELMFSESFACINCGISIEEISPRMFSFNSPYGACPNCNGLGSKIEIDPDLIIPDKNKSIYEGAIKPWGYPSSANWEMLKSLANHYNFDLHSPFKDLPNRAQEVVLYGSGNEDIEFSFQVSNIFHKFRRPFEGIINNLKRRHKETKSEYIRNDISKFMGNYPCTHCHGARLRKESLAIKINGLSINDTTKMSIERAHHFFKYLSLSKKDSTIAHQILKEITSRLTFMINVGLSYLTLDRQSNTLSGGESQRIRLATQVGSGLVGVLYVLDEPSIGLHQKDNRRLISTLTSLRDLGNTLIVVEHDETTIRTADYIIDLGPKAGDAGGFLVACGSLRKIINKKESLTGSYLRGDLKIPVPKKRKKPKINYFIEIIRAKENNLKSINVKIPLGLFTCITGLSGSGKSTLIEETLYPALQKYLYNSSVKPGKHELIKGFHNIDKVIDIDQSPIGRTPRSNPATYTGVFIYIRDFFAKLPESKIRGYKPGRFSFNVKGGRCEACEGDGIIKIEMHFLPDVYISCEICKGKRYNQETLEVKYKGKNISDVLNMSVNEALEFYKNIPSIKRKLITLKDVGLGYIKLGQSATTLSGGEAQRVKLSTELSKKYTGKTLYLLDEPTTGLHFADIQNLLNILLRLRNSGNTIVVVEHNLDVIKTADHIIDLGPEGGDNGGNIVAEGTPEKVSQNNNSYTGQFLKEVLN